MTGIAAISICAAFTSCSKDADYEQMTKDEMSEANYETAFTSRFGEIAPNHDWGFEQFREGVTRGYSTNHNLWGDPNADGGSWNWKVPPMLTDGQRLRVKLYFQYHPWLTYEDPHLTNFFVQQVYKGGTSPIASQSLEVYPTGDNGSAIGGEQMDLLTVGTPGTGSETAYYYDHVNDFNNGNYNGGSTVQVLNTGGSTNNYSTDSHPDMITLMVNSKTDCVGYWSSNGSTGHNERCALAGAEEIDAWATSAEAIALGINLGEAVVDGWDRSFVGLDYDGVYGDNIYAKDGNGIRYAKLEDAMTGKEYAWDGQRVVKFSELIAQDPYFRDKEGNKIPYTINERNMFIGTNSDLSGQSAYIIQKEGYGDVIDLTVIQRKIDDACLPCDGKLYQWTKNVGGRDHVYSDWIVTLTRAEKQTEKKFPDPNVRVFAEDLAVTQTINGTVYKGDFDFNDVVFDVVYDDGEGNTWIILQAAGGTYHIEVDGIDVHQQFDVPDNQMVNTWGYGSVSKSPVYIKLTNKYSDANEIPVVVTLPHETRTLTARMGKAPHKIAVKPGTRWASERQSIEYLYPTFYQWVKNPTHKWWEETYNQ